MDRVTADGSATAGLSDAAVSADVARYTVEGYLQLDQFLAEARNPLAFGHRSCIWSSTTWCTAAAPPSAAPRMRSMLRRPRTASMAMPRPARMTSATG